MSDVKPVSQLAAPEPRTPRPQFPRRRIVTEETGVLGALVVLVVVIGVVHPDFLQVQSLTSVLRDTAFVGVMALGMVFLVSMQELDLSVGSIFGLSAVVCAMLIHAGINGWLAGLITLAVSAVLGVFNALVANLFRLPAIIVTLGTLSVYRGLDLVISQGGPISTPGTGSFFDVLGGNLVGLPTSVWILIIATLVLHLVYRWTRFGTLVRAVGSNSRAAEFSGIPVRRIRLQALTLTAVLCGVSGVLSVAFFGSADPSLGTGQEIVVIAAVIIGGTSLAGGTGTVIGGLIGAVLITVINAGLVYFGVGSNWGLLVTGLVIIGAVALDSTLRQKLFRSFRRVRTTT